MSTMIIFFLIEKFNKKYSRIENPIGLFCIINLIVSFSGLIMGILFDLDFQQSNALLAFGLFLSLSLAFIVGNFFAPLLITKFNKTNQYKKDIYFKIPSSYILITFVLGVYSIFYNVNYLITKLGFKFSLSSLYLLVTEHYYYLDHEFKSAGAGSFINIYAYGIYFIYTSIFLSTLKFIVSKQKKWLIIVFLGIFVTLIFTGDYIYQFLGIFIFLFIIWIDSTQKNNKKRKISILLIFVILIFTMLNLGYGISLINRIIPYTFGNYINISNLLENNKIKLFNVDVDNLLSSLPFNIGSYLSRLLSYDLDTVSAPPYIIEKNLHVSGNTLTFAGNISNLIGFIPSLLYVFLWGFFSQLSYLLRYRNVFYFSIYTSFMFTIFGSFASLFIAYVWCIIFSIYTVPLFISEKIRKIDRY